MNFLEKFTLRSGLSLILLFVTSFSLFAQNDYPTLFDASETEEWTRVDAEPNLLRGRTLKIDTGALTTGEFRAVGQAVHLNLFEDVKFLAVAEKIYDNPSGSTTWIGYLEGVDQGSATFVITPEGIVAGSVVLPDGVFKVRYAGKDQHLVYELDLDSMPPDAEPIEVTRADSRETAEGTVQTFADSGSVIDVLVVYTAAARSAAGGDTAMKALVDLAVAETNTSYSNSGVNTQLNLVYRGEISYNETGNFSTDLGRLANKTDGYMDNVHSLRDQYCADTVALIINATQYCGIAYIMTNVSASFEDRAFSVTARTCATGYYSFGHELGHNMGARHDWYVDSNTTPYVYNHGYVNVSNNWRTIMAYNSECSANGTNCTRLQYWSNPNVNYQGNAMGVGGSTAGSSANNALALNNSLATFANFRDSTTGNCGGSTGGGCNGTSYSGSLSGTGTGAWQPNGTYYYATAGNHTGELTGPSNANFDLRLYKWTGSWTIVATSTNGDSNENISYNGTAGYYVWRVLSANGSGNYDLCLDTP